MSLPPRAPKRDTRIKPGEVRNPYGRNGKPKPMVGFLDEEVTISINGIVSTVSRREALDHFLFANSAQGKIPAIRLLHRLHHRRRLFVVPSARERATTNRAADGKVSCDIQVDKVVTRVGEFENNFSLLMHGAIT